MKLLFIRRPPLAIPLLNRLPTSYSHSVATTGLGGKLSKSGPRLMSRDINRNYVISKFGAIFEIFHTVLETDSLVVLTNIWLKNLSKNAKRSWTYLDLSCLKYSRSF